MVTRFDLSVVVTKNGKIMGEKHTYFCPIRGSFDSVQAEEEYVIECLNWLIKEKKVPEDYIEIQKPLFKFGAGGRNSIKPDILVFSCRVDDAKDKKGDFLLDKISLVVEVKVNPEDKESALKHQIYPVMNVCKNIIGGLYWDSAIRSYINKDKKEHSVLNLPDGFFHGKSGDVIIRRESLMPLKRGDKIWVVLDNVLRTQQGASKGQVYEDLFKILVSKYFDESKNDPLEFGIFGDDADKVFTRINKLYKRANNVYKLQESFRGVALDISLNKDTLYACVKVLESYSLKETDRAIIQEFYMKFAPVFLKQDLKQYYTPKEIITFMTENVKLKKDTHAIDPCCGTGDFMVGVLRKAHKAGIGSDIEEGLYCWDINDTASKLAKMNMILNGDGRVNVRTIDSLNECDEDNGRYDYVITNPPFGQRSLFEGNSLSEYDLGHEGINETGKLFFERSLNLLKENGILISIAPTGYMDNPRQRADVIFRKTLFNRFRAIGYVLLPAGAFKAAGAGVTTSIIILQKTKKPPADYKIFVAVARTIGFDVSSKETPVLIRRRDNDGAYLRDEDNNLQIDNDLVDISEQLKSFTADEKLKGFDKPKNKQEYDYVDFSKIQNNGFIINPRMYDRRIGYAATVRKIKRHKHFNLSGNSAISVSNNDRLRFVPSKHYHYIETGDVYKGQLKDAPEMRGWELPGRAKQCIEEGDILVAKMGGSAKNFLYVFPEWNGYIASNGFYKVRIPDERLRLSFYRFLFGSEYLAQAGALPTGSIMGDIKEEDFKSHLYIPVLDDKGVAQIKEYLKHQNKFVSLGII